MSRGGGRRILAAVAVAVMAAACGDSDVLHQSATPGAPREAGATASQETPPSSTAPPSTTRLTVPSTTPPTTQPTTAALRSVRLAFTGDSMAHSAISAQGRRNGEHAGVPYDFDPMWARLAPIVSRADFALCHLETTITTGDAAPTGFPRFRAPREYVEALAAAGYDACSTASNHTFDHGVDGVVQTIDALESSGLGWAGSARTEEEAATPRLYTAAGVRVGLISATYGLNGFRLPADKPWMVTAIDVPYLLSQARAARDAGAEIVVASLHCCVEYRVEPTGAQVEQARALLESDDVDIVVGHHAHVVQPIERVGDKYVLYGLGNILSNMYASRCCPAASQDGVVVEVTFMELPGGRFTATEVAFTPTWVDRSAGLVVTPVATALRDPDLPASRRAELEASWWRTVAAINLRGAADDGVIVTAD